MKNVSVEELLGVLQKSGLPYGNGAQMQGAQLGARDQISNTAYAQNTRLPQAKSTYQAQLAQIAQMDEKLASVYSDPSSPTYINHPLQREKIYASAADKGYSAAGTLGKQVTSEVNDTESKIDDALKVYKDLTSEQVKAEKEAEKLAKKSKTGAKKSSINGVSTTITKNQQVAGFKDAAAAQFWQNIKETDFKRNWVSAILQGLDVPNEGFTIDDVRKQYNDYQDGMKRYKAEQKKTGGGSNLDKLSALIDQRYSKK